jgi:acyl-coenzyme A synthetase/AMP-(fatty) acid ligase
VVARGVDRDTILYALAQQLDPVLVPRPLVLVERLPRNETGKVPRAALLAVLGMRHG